MVSKSVQKANPWRHGIVRFRGDASGKIHDTQGHDVPWDIARLQLPRPIRPPHAFSDRVIVAVLDELLPSIGREATRIQTFARRRAAYTSAAECCYGSRDGERHVETCATRNRERDDGEANDDQRRIPAKQPDDAQ